MADKIYDYLFYKTMGEKVLFHAPDSLISFQSVTKKTYYNGYLGSRFEHRGPKFISHKMFTLTAKHIQN